MSTRRSPKERAALLILPALAMLSLPGRADEPPTNDESFVNPGTAVLELYVGPWAVTQKHFDPTGAVVATVKGTEEVQWVVDRHAIQRIYQTTGASTVYRALGLLSFDAKDELYRGIWVDNASTTGPSTVKGEWQADSRTMVLTMDARDSDGGAVQYKVIERFMDAEKRSAVTYRLDGERVIKLLEVEYVRTIPCPGKIRVIFDGLQRGGD